MAVQLSLALHDGLPIANLSRRATSCEVVTDLHGESSLQATVRMPRLAEQFRYYDREGGLDLVLTDTGKEVWRGRLEEVGVGSAGLTLVAFGTWRALSDTRHTALWSDTSARRWELLTETDIASLRPDFYEFDTQNRVHLGLTKGTTYANGIDYGFVGYQIPDDSSRDIQNWAFDAEVNLPTNWSAIFQSRDSTYGSTTNLKTITGTGAAIPCTYCLVLATPRPRINLITFNNTGASVTYAGENSQNYVRLTNIRVTTTPLLVDTVATATVFGGDTTITLSSVANITVGMILIIQATTGTPRGERAQVASIAGLVVTLTGPTAFSYSIGANQVRAQAVRATDIAAALVSEVNATNPAQIRAVGRFASTTADYTDEVYEDVTPADVLDRLAFLENRVVAARNGTVSLRTKDDARFSQTWYIDVTEMEATRLLDAVTNRVYATYQDASNRTLRQDKTDAGANSRASQRRHGVIRESALDTDTTSSTNAAAQGAIRLADSADPPPKVQVTFSRVLTRGGQRVAPTRVRAGDTLVIRNLSRALSANIDQIASFRIARTTYDAISRELAVEAEVPADTLANELARADANPDAAPLAIRTLSRTPVIILT